MDPGGVKDEQGRICLRNQQADLCAAENDTLGTLPLQAGNDLRKLLPGIFLHDAETQFFINYPVHKFYTFTVRDHHINACLQQFGFVKILGHGVFRAQKTYFCDACFLQGIGGGFCDVEQGNGDPLLHLGGDLVHGVGADHQEVGTGSFQIFRSPGQYFGAFLPASLGLIFLNLGKIHAVKKDFGGVETAQTLLDGFVENLIIGDSAFPAHAADESDGFHIMVTSCKELSTYSIAQLGSTCQRHFCIFGHCDEIHLEIAHFPLAFCAIFLYNEFKLWVWGRWRLGELFAVLSGKGGTGKTSVCAGIATALAQEGLRVLCIDCDVGLRNLDISLGIADSGALSFLDVSQGHYPLEQAARHPLYPNLFFLTAPMNCPAEKIDADSFGDFLREARRKFDYIFLDAPAGVDAGFRLVSKGAERFLLVTGAGPAAVRDAARVGDILELMGKKDVRLIVNRVDRKLLGTVQITVDDVMDNAGLPLMGIVPEDANVTLAASFGHPLFYFAPKCPAAKAFRRIARRVQGYHQRITLK